MTLYYMATIDIRTIKVLLDTNIPGKEIVPLTKSILYQPKMDTGKWNDMPFFTMDAEYPETYLSRFTYEEQMEFFFVKRKMMDILRMKSQIIQKSDNVQFKTKSKMNEEKSDLIKNKISNDKAKLDQDDNIKIVIENEQKETAKINYTISSIECRLIENIEGLPNNSITYKNGGFFSGSKLLTIGDKNIKKIEDYKAIINNREAELSPYKDIIDNFFKKKNEMFELYDAREKDSNVPCKTLTENNSELRVFKNIPTKSDPFWIDLIKVIQHMRNVNSFSKNVPNNIEKKIQDITFNVEWENVTPANYYPIQKKMCELLYDINNIIPELTKLKLAMEMPNKSIDIFDKQIIDNKKLLIDIREKYQKERLSIANTPVNTQANKEIIEDINPSDYESNRSKNGEKNIMIMIRLMFPTKYPLVGNIFSSFHSVVTGKNEFNLKWTDFIPNFFKKQLFEGLKDYSYLKLDGTIYTVTQAIWLNDIYNHKEYKALIYKFEELQRWKDKQITKNNNELMKRYKLFQQTYRTGIYELNISDIEIIRKTLNVNAPEQSKGYVTADNLNKYKTMVKGLIQSLEQLLLSIQSESINKNSIIDNATKFVEIMRELRDGNEYRAWFRLESQERFDKIRRKMNEDIDNIKAEQFILEMYLKRPGINMDYEKDTKYKSIIDQKYSTYTRFVENIRKFRAPVLESSNLALQNTIEDFLNNTEKVKNVFIFLMNPINVKKNPFSELVNKTTGKESDELREEAMTYQERLNTGITIRPSAQEGQPYYEVYIQVNVIGGEVNDDNKSAVDCMYQGESLGDKLARLLNEALYLPWTMNNSRIFFDITKGDAKVQIENQDKDKKDIENQEKGRKEGSVESTLSEKKMGGKTRNFREYLMKTKRRYPVVS
jgi:hypothetical protein